VGVCRGCGAYTQPRNGKGDAYAYCKDCHPWRDRAPLDARARAAYIEQARFYPAELTGGPDDDTESRKRAVVALSTRVARAVDDYAVSAEILRDVLTTLRSGSVDRAG
jgi:hypothetical protein